MSKKLKVNRAESALIKRIESKGYSRERAEEIFLYIRNATGCVLLRTLLSECGLSNEESSDLMQIWY